MNKSGVKLLVCVCAALALAFILYGLRDREKKGGDLIAGKNIMVTKPYPRDGVGPDGRSGRVKNPLEEFEVARKQGMTNQEVRWVVEDLVNRGIDSDKISADTAEGYYQLRVKRQRWFLDALVSGFGLSNEQKGQAAARLRDLGERDYEEFQEYLAGMKPFETEGETYQVVDGSKVRKLTDADEWLRGDEYLPWNLCNFNEVQKEMVPLKYENEAWSWPRPGSVTTDFGTEDRYENLDDPQTSQNGFITPSGKIFPLSMEQVDRIRSAHIVKVKSIHGKNGKITKLDEELTIVGRFGPLRYVKLLSPPQLKTLLIFRPDMAESLLKELDKRSGSSNH